LLNLNKKIKWLKKLSYGNIIKKAYLIRNLLTAALRLIEKKIYSINKYMYTFATLPWLIDAMNPLTVQAVNELKYLYIFADRLVVHFHLVVNNIYVKVLFLFVK
jgi:hypothetical protein